MTTNQPARRPAQTQTIARKTPAQAEQTVKDLVRGSWEAITGSLPDTMDSKRFARLVFNAVRKTPLLAEATAASMLGSVLTASALGLEIGLNNEAHLVPYKRKDRRTGKEWVEAQLIVGYGGIAKLFQQHPMARGVNTNWVGEHDHFEYEYGTSSKLVHRPKLGNRGRPIAYWASYELANGVRDFLVLDPVTVARLRGKDVEEKRDIEDPEHWMERKTVLKQVLKLAPKSTSLQWAMAVDEKPGSELHAERAHVAITAGEVIPDTAPVVETDDIADADLVYGDVEEIDLTTGEVIHESGGAGGEAANGGSAPPTPDAAPVRTPAKRATITALVRELDRCGVQPSAVDAYLPIIGATASTVGELDADEAVALLEFARALDRDKLAGMLAAAQTASGS